MNRITQHNRIIKIISKNRSIDLGVVRIGIMHCGLTVAHRCALSHTELQSYKATPASQLQSFSFTAHPPIGGGEFGCGILVDRSWLERKTLTGSGLGECRKRGSIGSLLAVGGIGKG